MSCKNDYASHDEGDCAYDHRGENVKVSVLGVAVALTLGFSAVELITGWLANSLALIGDAGHMATDSASLFFALVANLISRKGVDADHSFGHGRIEVLAAFLNGLVMLGVVCWIFFEAFDRLSNPAQVNGGSVMLVATLGLLINVAVAWSLSRDNKNVNTRAALVHVMGDLHVWTLAPNHGAVMAHLCMRDGVRWERVLTEAQSMLRERFALEHVTLQPEWSDEHKMVDKLDDKPTVVPGAVPLQNAAAHA